MCRKLDAYIQKSYLAEIEKKNAQLQALQSQINPHFLYNTLEAIRMKAICNGDRDVGKMLTGSLSARSWTTANSIWSCLNIDIMEFLHMRLTVR